MRCEEGPVQANLQVWHGAAGAARGAKVVSAREEGSSTVLWLNQGAVWRYVCAGVCWGCKEV